MSLPDDQLTDLPDQAVPVLAGDVLAGKYRIGRIVGLGGMATVAAGHHLELDQPVAIKFLSAEAAARPDSVLRFLREARAAARLNSPHVARVLDVGTARTANGGAAHFLVMELLEGMDLDAILMERGRLPVHEAVEYVVQACAGVAEAHALGIIHRDLKPGNLFLTRRRDGAPLVKLLDFGISKHTGPSNGADAAGMTTDREMMGSPRYMSPEQVRSSKNVDTRTDVWSLGVILHELVAGAPPFQADTIADTLVAILHAPPEPMAKTAPDVPPALVQIVSRCLQKTADRRFSTVDELAAALEPFRSEDAGHAEAAGVLVQTLHAKPRPRASLTALHSVGAIGLVLLAFVVLSTLRGTAQSSGTRSPAAAPTADEPMPPMPLPPPASAPVASELSLSAPPPAADDETISAPVTTKPASIGPRPPASPAMKPGASTAPRHRTDW